MLKLIVFMRVVLLLSPLAGTAAERARDTDGEILLQAQAAKVMVGEESTRLEHTTAERGQNTGGGVLLQARAAKTRVVILDENVEKKEHTTAKRTHTTSGAALLQSRAAKTRVVMMDEEPEELGHDKADARKSPPKLQFVQQISQNNADLKDSHVLVEATQEGFSAHTQTILVSASACALLAAAIALATACFAMRAVARANRDAKESLLKWALASGDESDDEINLTKSKEPCLDLEVANSPGGATEHNDDIKSPLKLLNLKLLSEEADMDSLSDGGSANSTGEPEAEMDIGEPEAEMDIN